MSNSPAPGLDSEAAKTPFLQELQAFSRLVLGRFAKDRGLGIAAALSYTSLLALVPLGAIAFAVLRAFPVFEDVEVEVKSFVFEYFMPDSVNDAQLYFDQFVGAAGGMTAVGIIGLAITAIMLLSTIENALNTIFHVHARRPLASRLLMYWAVLTMGPLLLGGSLTMATYLFALTEWMGVGKIPGVAGVAAQLAPGALAIFAFTLFYAVVPYRQVLFRHAVFGGVVAGILFGLVRRLFALYIAAFPSYQTIYGAMAVVPIFLIWMYFSWAMILIGAEIAASLPQWGRARAAANFEDMAPARRLDAALAAIERLWRKGRGEKIPHPTRNPWREDILAQALDVLRDSGFVGLSDDGEWLLARDPDVLTIADVAHGLGLAPAPDDLPPGGPPWRPALKDCIGGTEGAGYGVKLCDLFAGNRQ
ncbi:MAG: YihY family inner membrane protein [Alphaproteobacteria bacterium]|nr:YihY family inner membrane protein [Alphaproteobacteria bacterium]MBF0251707.1 YihY family inner membrane protein [Alphaproteobacteria bacterium]